LRVFIENGSALSGSLAGISAKPSSMESASYRLFGPPHSKGISRMPKVTYVSAKGDAREIDVPAGTTVMAAALKNGIDGIVAECGGVCMCSTCHVFVDEKFFGRLPPANDTEEAVLEISAEERQATSRLSCQIKVTEELDGLIVRLPHRQR
jgi:2Fe-2S ferredoxin